MYKDFSNTASVNIDKFFQSVIMREKSIYITVSHKAMEYFGLKELRETLPKGKFELKFDKDRNSREFWANGKIKQKDVLNLIKDMNSELKTRISNYKELEGEIANIKKGKYEDIYVGYEESRNRNKLLEEGLDKETLYSYNLYNWMNKFGSKESKKVANDTPDTLKEKGYTNGYTIPKKFLNDKESLKKIVKFHNEELPIIEKEAFKEAITELKEFLKTPEGQLEKNKAFLNIAVEAKGLVYDEPNKTISVSFKKKSNANNFIQNYTSVVQDYFSGAKDKASQQYLLNGVKNSKAIEVTEVNIDSLVTTYNGLKISLSVEAIEKLRGKFGKGENFEQALEENFNKRLQKNMQDLNDGMFSSRAK